MSHQSFQETRFDFFGLHLSIIRTPYFWFSDSHAECAAAQEYLINGLTHPLPSHFFPWIILIARFNKSSSLESMKSLCPCSKVSIRQLAYHCKNLKNALCREILRFFIKILCRFPEVDHVEAARYTRSHFWNDTKTMSLLLCQTDRKCNLRFHNSRHIESHSRIRTSWYISRKCPPNHPRNTSLI
jgi:hypothetical protein